MKYLFQILEVVNLQKRFHGSTLKPNIEIQHSVSLNEFLKTWTVQMEVKANPSVSRSWSEPAGNSLITAFCSFEGYIFKKHNIRNILNRILVLFYLETGIIAVYLIGF